MNPYLPTLTAFGLAFCNAQAQVTVGLDFVDAANPGVTDSIGSGVATFSTSATGELVMGSVQSATQSLGAVTLTDGAFTGVYHISVDVASTGTGDSDVGRGGSGTLSPGGDLLTVGEQLTFSNVTLTFVSGSNVFQFDGFTGIRIGNLSGAEVITANEITIADGNTGEGSGSSFTPTAPFNLAPTIVVDSTNGGSSVNVVDAQFSVNTDIQAPAVPTNLAVTVANASGELFLDWEDNGQFGFTNFILRRSLSSGGPYTDIATPNVSEFSDSGLVNGTPYFYVVAAENTLDEVSTNSIEASGTPEFFVPDPPTSPTNLTVIVGNEVVLLNWDDNEQAGFQEFRISRATSLGGPYSQIGTAIESAFTDNTVSNETTYYYVVTAVNSDNVVSSNSNESPPATPSQAATPPNFVFIITDDQDIYSIGAYRALEPTEFDASNSPYLVDTPNIDRLASEGMIFHQARTMGSQVAAVCVGTRTSIMSGKNAWENATNVTGADTFPGTFNVGPRDGFVNRPYATYRTCKSGNSFDTANVEFTVRNDATRRGNTDGSGSEWHKDRALEHIADWQTNHQATGTPFLMYLGFSHPHDVRNARETPALTTRYGCLNINTIDESADSPLSALRTDATAPPLPFNYLPATPSTYPAHPFNHGHLNVRDEVNVQGVARFRTEAVVRNEIGRNLACVDWIDQQVGIVLDRLEDPNNDGDTSDSVLDNTYIVFTSDHGMSIGRHGLMGKQNLYEHTWRVPYIVRGPGITANSRSDALIYLHDTFPTFCDLAGIEVPDTIDINDGRSFRAVLEGTSTEHRDRHYGIYAGGSRPGIRAVTDGRFKLIKYDVDSSRTQVTQMFDIQTNPFELLPEHGTPNIADAPAYAAIRNNLEALMMQQRLENNDPDPFQGDRTLFRFELGNAGETPSTHLDEFPFTNDGNAISGTGGSLPVLKTDVPSANDFVLGDPNTLSLAFEQDLQQYLEIPHSDRAVNFGPVPFTIEAWVKLASLPATNNFASAMPVVMKKVIGTNDSSLDYLFLAAAGNYGSSTTFDRLAVHLGNSAIVSTLSIPDTNWHHISVAVNPTTNTLRFTMDDQVDVQTVTAFGTANIGPLIVGSHFDSSAQIDSSFDGCLDELSITDGFLSLAELQPLAAVTEVSHFEITDFDFDPENLTFNLTFNSDETRLYTIERSTTLEPNDWAELEDYSLIQGALGTDFTTTPTLPLLDSNLTTREFFRVKSGNN